MNPHRGDRPSITFFGPGGSIRRHVELSETDLRRRSSARATSASLLSAAAPTAASFPGPVHSARLADYVSQDDSLTHVTYTTSTTEQVWVYKYSALIHQSVLVYDGETFIGASAIAYGDNQLLLAEVWTPASAMPSEPPEPPDPEWEWETSERLHFAPDPSLGFCLAAIIGGCGEALLGATFAGVGTYFATKGCFATGGLVCGWSRLAGAWFVDRVLNAIHECGGYHTSHPTDPLQLEVERIRPLVHFDAIA